MKIGFDGEKYFCVRCGKTFGSNMAVVGHQRTCKVRKVDKIVSVNLPYAQHARGGGAQHAQQHAQRYSGELSGLDERLSRVENVLFNEVNHRLALIQQPEPFRDWSKVLKWVGVGFGVFVIFLFLSGSKDSHLVFSKIGDKVLSKAIDKVSNKALGSLLG